MDLVRLHGREHISEYGHIVPIITGKLYLDGGSVNRLEMVQTAGHHGVYDVTSPHQSSPGLSLYWRQDTSGGQDIVVILEVEAEGLRVSRCQARQDETEPVLAGARGVLVEEHYAHQPVHADVLDFGKDEPLCDASPSATNFR
ncbi:unnamed protein product [Clonostachys chloroleuca]|uniref:Uncharacterized protein n=1 Tax=Clonostachys chloroleuca TaxID=1926264 RepID=A0AA35PWD0_9HYPO|nr:unnamed protein product [Clonostachys chloroleuca]